MWHSRPPPFMANAILNFHFDFLNTSLTFPPRRALTEGKDHTEEKDLREGKALIAAVRGVGKLS